MKTIKELQDDLNELIGEIIKGHEKRIKALEELKVKKQ